MQTTSILRKWLAIAIILLFSATCFIPATSQSISINTPVQNNFSTGERGIWTEIQKLLPVSEGKFFGSSISIDGETALIGVFGGDGNEFESGCAYVYTRSGTTWTHQAKLSASDGVAFDGFGCSVSLSGDTALIGAIWNHGSTDASGSVYVFTRSGTIWTQQAKLFALDGAYEDRFGCSTSLDHDTAIIGAMSDDDMGNDSGSAYIFTRTQTTWTQQAKLLASDGEAGDAFGHSVCLGDNYAFVSSINDDNYGSVHVFTRNGWTQTQKLFASDESSLARFGFSISIDEPTALISAPQTIDNGPDSGSAYLFTCSDSVWTQQAKVVPSDGEPYDYTGYSVSLKGDTALIGATGHDDNGEDSGSAYIFIRTGTAWIEQQKLLASDGAENDVFGSSVSIFGNTAFIGAELEDGNGTDSGSVYIFQKAGLNYSITGGLGVSLMIKNSGVFNATSIPWQLNVRGGLLGKINKTLNGSIDIPAGGSKTMGTGMLFGFGTLTITVKVAYEETTSKGKQILIFSMVKK